MFLYSTIKTQRYCFFYNDVLFEGKICPMRSDCKTILQPLLQMAFSHTPFCENKSAIEKNETPFCRRKTAFHFCYF